MERPEGTTGGLVRVLPKDLTIEVGPEEALMAAAQRTGHKWPTVCGGEASCRACWLSVESGYENTSPIQPLEKVGLSELRGQDQARLACQMGVNGPVTVRKRGVRRIQQTED